MNTEYRPWIKPDRIAEVSNPRKGEELIVVSYQERPLVDGLVWKSVTWQDSATGSEPLDIKCNLLVGNAYIYLVAGLQPTKKERQRGNLFIRNSSHLREPKKYKKLTFVSVGHQ